MAGILVAYFSRSGTVARVAEQLAAKLGAEVDRIETVQSYKGIYGYFTGIVHALFRRKMPVHYQRDPKDFSLVILGSPVWAGHLSVPMRSYLNRERGRFRNVAAFWVSGSGRAYQSIKSEIEELTDCECAATATFSMQEVTDGTTEQKLREMSRSIDGLAIESSR